MSTEQLKNLVIDKISGMEDENFLRAIKTILDTNTANASIYQLTEEQQAKVKTGLDQLAQGKILTNEDLEKAADEWLKE